MTVGVGRRLLSMEDVCCLLLSGPWSKMESRYGVCLKASKITTSGVRLEDGSAVC
jgi:hypothetical protein